MLAGYVYKITNTETGQVYIGSTGDVDQRFKRHKSLLRHNRHENTHMQNSYNLYGKDAFYFEVIEHVSEAILEREQYWIDIFFDNGLQCFNINSVAAKPPSALGRVASQETRRRMASSKLGNTTWRGRTHTEEAKQRISEANKGRVSFRDEGHPNSKLTLDQVDQIRCLREVLKLTQQKLADQFNVSRGNIRDILNCKTWKAC